MKLERPARAALPIPLSVLLTLLWAGLVHLLLLLVRTQSFFDDRGARWARVFWSERLPGGIRLPTLLVAISLLLLFYLWLSYRARPAGGPRGWVFLAAAGLLVYLAWVVWRIWWQQMQAPTPGGGSVLLAALGGSGG